MAEAPIKHSDLIEEGVFDPTIKEGERLEVVLNNLINSFKELGKVTGKKAPISDPKTVSEVEQLNQALSKQREILSAENAIRKQLNIITEQNAQRRRREKDEAKAAISAYAKLNLEYKIALQRAKDLGAQYGLTNKQFLEAAAAANTLNNRLKVIDERTGNYQRNVGNYTGSVKTLGKAFSGLTGIISVVGAALGFNTEALDKLTSVGREVVHVTKDLTDIKKVEKVVTDANTVSTEVNTAATTKATLAQRIYASTIGFVTDSIKKLTTAQGLMNASLIAIAAALAANAYNLYKQIQALPGAEQVLKKWTKQNEDATYALEQLNKQQEINTQSLIDNSKAQEQILEASGATATELYNQRQKTFDLEKQQLMERGKFVDEQRKLQEDYLEKLLLLGRKILKENPGVDTEKLKEDNELFRQVTENIDTVSESINDLGIESMQLSKQLDGLDKLQQLLNINKNNALRKEQLDNIKRIQQGYETEAQQRFNNSQETLKDQLTLENDLYNIKSKSIEQQMDLFEANSDEYKDYLNQLYALTVEYEEKKQDLVNKGIIDDFNEEKKRNKDEFDAEVKGGEAVFAEQRYIAQKTIKSKKEETKKLLEIDLAQAKYNLEIAEKYGQDTVELQKAVYDAEIALLNNAEAEYKKVLERRISMFEKLYEGVFKRLESRAKQIRDANNEYITEIDRQIETQTQLAIAGQRNVLDYLTRERAKALEDRAEQDKKDRKREQAQELASVFLEFYKEYAKEGDVLAALKALKATFTGKSIATAIAGSAFEGTDDTGGPGTMDSKGGKLWMLHPHEGVVNRGANEENPGLVKAMNEGKTQEWFYRNMVTPEMRTAKQVAVEQAANVLLNRKMDELIKTVRDKREFTLGLNAEQEAVYIEKIAGMVRKNTIKNSNHTDRKHPFA